MRNRDSWAGYSLYVIISHAVTLEIRTQNCEICKGARVRAERHGRMECRDLLFFFARDYVSAARNIDTKVVGVLRNVRERRRPLPLVRVNFSAVRRNAPNITSCR